MPTQWEKIQPVERMRDYIESHLAEPITLAALARAARYSQWHAARLFKEVTGKSPFEYIRLRRLSAAATKLRDAPTRVVDVAFDFVFDSHEEGVEKPDPRIFEIALDRSRADRYATIHCGDIYHIDVAGARAAGLPAVLLDSAGLYTDADCPRVRSLPEFAEQLLAGAFD